MSQRLLDYLFVWAMSQASLHPAVSIEIRKLCLGRDETVTFHHPLTGARHLTYELFTGTLECLFYQNGHKTEARCLEQGQRDRFHVNVHKTAEKLNVTLAIHNVQTRDSGVYLLLVGDERDGERHHDVKDVYVDVKAAPDKAQCNHSNLSAERQTVSCSAPLASDGGGLVVCFEGNKMAPFLQQPTYSAAHIHAVFEINLGSSVQCCSYTADCEKHIDDCIDFVHHVPSKDSSPNIFPTLHTVVDENIAVIERSTEISSSSAKSSEQSKLNASFAANEDSDVVLGAKGVSGKPLMIALLALTVTGALIGIFAAVVLFALMKCNDYKRLLIPLLLIVSLIFLMIVMLVLQITIFSKWWNQTE